METKIFDVRSIIKDSAGLLSELKEAAQMLASGKTIAFPTETVYGLGANALNEAAVKKIFEAKGRPSDNPLIVHIAELAQLDDLVSEIPEKALLLMKHFWPGSLSIIMRKTPLIPDCVTAGLDTVAIRMPKNSEAFILLKLADCPVAAPSANLSGKPSPTSPEHVLHDLDGKVDGIVLGRNCDVGIESTVIDLCSDPPIILRPGIVTQKDIETVIGPVRIAPNGGDTSATPRAPGMKYTHYAPNAPMILFKGTPEAMFTEICERALTELHNEKKVGIIATDNTFNRYLRAFQNHQEEAPLHQNGITDQLSSAMHSPTILNAGSRNNLKTVAHDIFSILREFDDSEVDIILSESFENEDVGFSIMNRMDKAASEISQK